VNDGLRIGDAEREEAARELGEHFALGRITAEEHSERLEQVWSARTKADLAPAFRDLPRPQVRRSPQAAARERRAHPRFELPSVPFPLKVLLGIVLIWWGFHHLLLLVLVVAVYVVFVRRFVRRRRRWHERMLTGWH
jgi:hypothetical protein